MAERRTYTILGVVGSGGFGKVYRARLDAGDFSKEVAVKILHDADPPADVLRRFRDEARILGLLRDRAIVSVDPPTQLSGRWAVVMDFVDGQSASALARRFGALPPGVALEIIAEVARVLDKAYGFPGPAGEPLRLVHRDIKPANIQVTRSGEVRLLDFGVATAQFGAREALTTTGLSGTPGYLAPERLEGVDGPAGDVFSLGVTLWVLLTGEPASKRRAHQIPAAVDELAKEDGPLRQALLLAASMRSLEDTTRPTHRQVEQRCNELRRSMPGPWLREWAERIPETRSKQDELAGERLSETLAPTEVQSGALDVTVGRTLVVGGGLASMLGLVLLALLALVLVGTLIWLAMAPAEIDLASTPRPKTEAPAGLTAPEPAEDPDALKPSEPASAPATDPSTPQPAPQPEPAGPSTPTPVEPRPAPAEKNAESPPARPSPAPTRNVTLKSIPWGATVWIDGRKLPKPTPLKYDLRQGRAYEVQMELGGNRSKHRIVVGNGGPDTVMWVEDQGSWRTTP